MSEATTWEIAFFLLAVVGTIGSYVHVLSAQKDRNYVRNETNGDVRERRVLVLRGHVRDAVITLALQLSVFIVASTYILSASLGGHPTSGSIWIIRGTFLAIEALLILQIARRRLERKRLVEMIVESEGGSS